MVRTCADRKGWQVRARNTDSPAAAYKKVSADEISRHISDHDAWMVINDTVWNISDFASVHPGGEAVIRENHGKDASKIYNYVHSVGLVAKHLGADARIGEVDPTTMTASWETGRGKQGGESYEGDEGPTFERPPLSTILNLYDFEEVARKALTPRAWAYSSGASNDGLTLAANVDWYRKIFFRPRVLTGVKSVDASRTILGQKYEVPIFNSPVSLVKLAHPDGEVAIARATATTGTTTIIPTLASFTIDEMVEALPKGHPFFFQLYVNQDRSVTEKLLQEVAVWKPQAIIITVDLPVFSKREANERFEDTVQRNRAVATGSLDVKKPGAGKARSASAAINPDLQWKDIRWVSETTKLPVFVKGIQCALDARQAYDNGCSGIYISNHGGRAADTAPPGILTLMEIQANCPDILARMEVFVDGGIRRGSDILKAICLGASAVCLGRPFFYALVYGQEGVEHAIQSLSLLHRFYMDIYD